MATHLLPKVGSHVGVRKGPGEDKKEQKETTPRRMPSYVVAST
jgi:hypothetical protein